MILPAHELEAFGAVARTLSFSEAARRVHITQPALSQRIQSLERALGITLFVRDRKEVRLTDAGSRLLRYCQAKDHLEAELLNDLGEAPEGKLGGRLRIAGYSTVLQSVIVPALVGLLRDNPAVQFEFNVRELRELPGMLERGEADFIVLDRRLEQAGMETALLGYERYVLVQSSRFKVREVFLDHDPEDRSTDLFLRKQGHGRKNMRRCYMDDIHGIINGVALGLGQAVVPRHLLSGKLPIKIMEDMKTLDIPVILHYFRQAYYSKLQQATIRTITLGCAEILG